jgi:hypothetical protein
VEWRKRGAREGERGGEGVKVRLREAREWKDPTRELSDGGRVERSLRRKERVGIGGEGGAKEAAREEVRRRGGGERRVRGSRGVRKVETRGESDRSQRGVKRRVRGEEESDLVQHT